MIHFLIMRFLKCRIPLYRSKLFNSFQKNIKIKLSKQNKSFIQNVNWSDVFLRTLKICVKVKPQLLEFWIVYVQIWCTCVGVHWLKKSIWSINDTAAIACQLTRCFCPQPYVGSWLVSFNMSYREPKNCSHIRTTNVWVLFFTVLV